MKAMTYVTESLIQLTGYKQSGIIVVFEVAG